MSANPMPVLSSQRVTDAGLDTGIHPLLVVSPHYDDAVFSCGRLLAAMPGSTVVTVCTALPDDEHVLTDWASADLLGDTLLATIAEFRPASVFCPLGLFHADHLFVSDVLMTIGHHLPAVQWFAYAEIPYDKQAPLISERLAALSRRGIHPEAVSLEAPDGRKPLAVEAYRSQFRGLGYDGGGPVLQQQEQYWRIHHDLELL